MPRYKLSPIERAAEKERKENLRNIMKGLDVKNFDDLKDVFKMMVGEMLENGLDGELDDELGYTKYDYRNKEGESSRNGYSKKTLKTSFGETEIKVPRDRDGEFEPQLVKKNQTTLTGDIEEKIISMYAKGMTTSDIEAHIKDIYGLECSDTTISRITDKILPVVREWQSRPLEEIYAVVFMDAIHFHVRSEGQIIKKAVYIAIGINMEGQKEVLGMWGGENEEKIDTNREKCKTTELVPDVSRYDIYTLNIITKTAEGETSEKSIEFSLVNGPSKGTKNYKYGMCMHTNESGRTSVEEGLPTMGKIGAGFVREDFIWDNYEKEKGVYGFKGTTKEYYDKWFAYLEKENLKPLLIWVPSCTAAGVTGGTVPRTKEGLEALETAAYHFAAEYKGKAEYFELTNEPDFNRQESMSCVEYATALQYFYRGIKKGNPYAIVLAGGTSRANAGWLEGVLRDGG